MPDPHDHDDRGDEEPGDEEPEDEELPHRPTWRDIDAPDEALEAAQGLEDRTTWLCDRLVEATHMLRAFTLDDEPDPQPHEVADWLETVVDDIDNLQPGGDDP